MRAASLSTSIMNCLDGFVELTHPNLSRKFGSLAIPAILANVICGVPICSKVGAVCGALDPRLGMPLGRYSIPGSRPATPDAVKLNPAAAAFISFCSSSSYIPLSSTAIQPASSS